MEKEIKLPHLIDSLEGRIEFAQILLTKLCRQRALVNILKTAHYWALIGGVVRDALLTSSTSNSAFSSEWKDIDVALTEFPRKGLLRRSDRRNEQIHISRNHFGGIKVQSTEFGQMDLWLWTANKEVASRREFWAKQLDRVDFGINAVAFTWPACEVIVHPRWRQDIADSKIEKMADESPLRELQSIRAVALAAKMELKLKTPFELGQKAKRDLDKFLHYTSNEEMTSGFSYLEEKLRNERWPRYTVIRFLQLCGENKCRQEITKELLRIKKQYTIQDHLESCSSKIR